MPLKGAHKSAATKSWLAEHDYKMLGVWLPRPLVEAFKAECEATGQPIREVVGKLVYDWLEERA